MKDFLFSLIVFIFKVSLLPMVRIIPIAAALAFSGRGYVPQDQATLNYHLSIKQTTATSTNQPGKTFYYVPTTDEHIQATTTEEANTTPEEATSTTRDVTTTLAQSGGIASPQLRQLMEAFRTAWESCESHEDIRRIIAQIAAVSRSGTGGLSPVQILRTAITGWINPNIIQLIMLATNLNVERGQERIFAEQIGLSRYCTDNEVAIRQALIRHYRFDSLHHDQSGVRGDFESEVTLILRSFAADLPLYCPNIFDTIQLKGIAWRYRMHRIIYYGNGHSLNVAASRQTAFRESTDFLNSGNANSIRKGVTRVYFTGEFGIGDGVIRDWFSVMATQIYNPDYGLFKLREKEPRYIAVSPLAIHRDDFQTYLRTVGRFMALVLIQGDPIGVSLPVMYFAKLMEQDLRLEDIQMDEPDLHKQLASIMNATGEQILAKRWEIEIGGAGKRVTLENRQELVHQKINSLISADVEVPFGLIKEGFNEVIPIETLKGILTPTEVKGLMFGNPRIDVEDLRRHVQLDDGYTHEDPVIIWLFEYLRKSDQDTLKKFLRFVTGTSQVPFGGFANLRRGFTIRKTRRTDVFDDFPTASPSVNELHLPGYTSEQILNTRLHQAIKSQEETKSTTPEEATTTPEETTSTTPEETTSTEDEMTNTTQEGTRTVSSSASVPYSENFGKVDPFDRRIVPSRMPNGDGPYSNGGPGVQALSGDEVTIPAFRRSNALREFGSGLSSTRDYRGSNSGGQRIDQPHMTFQFTKTQILGSSNAQNIPSSALNRGKYGDQVLKAPNPGVAYQKPLQVLVPPNKIVKPSRPLGLGHFDSRDFSHVVVIPDVHGDAENFIHSLWIAFQKVEPSGYQFGFSTFNGVVRRVAESVEFPSGRPSSKPDKKLSTLGERVAIVQLGDIMDRGPQSLFSYKILASIETAIGWKLIQLFGNHDLMIYNPIDRKNFPDGFDLRYNIDPTDIRNEDAKRLFGPGGALRDYILNNDLVMARIGTPPKTDGKKYVIDPRSPDTLFVHAGLDIRWAFEFGKTAGIGWEYMIQSINERYLQTFKTDPSAAARLANDYYGPLFTREIPNSVNDRSKIRPGYSYAKYCVDLETLLEKLHVSRIIVGHTPDGRHETKSYCDGRFLVTDIAMSRGMCRGCTGQPYALVMTLGEGGSKIESMTSHYNHMSTRGIRKDIPILLR
jgi:hypothetical protein